MAERRPRSVVAVLHLAWNIRRERGLVCMPKEPVKPTQPPDEVPDKPYPVEKPPKPAPNEDRPLVDPVPPDEDLPRM